MTGSLGQFQSAFAAALLSPESVADPAVRRLMQQPAFAVYRNTVMKGCIDALESSFAAVARLVGSEWFRAAAALHVAADPPRDGRLVDYGVGFPDFLAHFGPASELVYLPGVARLDALWCQVHAAADADTLDARWLVGCEPEVLARLVLAPHPAARWAWFPELPVFTIWQRNRTADGMDDVVHDGSDIAWHGEGALIARPLDAVTSHAIDESGCAFLDACAAGLPLADAADRALAAKPDADLASLLEALLRAGAFASPDPRPSTESPS